MKNILLILSQVIFIGFLLSCKKNEAPQASTNYPYVGYYTDYNKEGIPCPKGVEIYYDSNGNLFMKGIDYWTCPDPIPMVYDPKAMKIDGYYGSGTHIEGTGYLLNDTIMLWVTNHALDSSQLFTNPMLHKYVKN